MEAKWSQMKAHYEPVLKDLFFFFSTSSSLLSALQIQMSRYVTLIGMQKISLCHCHGSQSCCRHFSEVDGSLTFYHIVSAPTRAVESGWVNINITARVRFVSTANPRGEGISIMQLAELEINRFIHSYVHTFREMSLIYSQEMWSFWSNLSTYFTHHTVDM